MRALWTLFKIVLVLAIGVPLAIVILSATLGLMTALVALAVRVAIVGLILWGVIRLAMAMFGSSPAKPAPRAPVALPPVDPYYESAKRELDRELGAR